MSFEYLRKIPTEDKIMRELPATDKIRKVKQERDKEILDVFKGKSDKLLLIIGPCSADNEDAVAEYVLRLSKVQQEVRDKLILIPRIYTNKPRTTGEGYKGMMHQPRPYEEPNIVKGLKAIRKMHLRILQETGLSAADEMLYPENYPYLEDLLSYVTIGARSVENQQHRLTVSGLDIPVGMKNPTSGDLTVMFNSVQAAQAPHVFIYNHWEVKTTGNPFAHCVLRGAINKSGQNIPNYHYEDLIKAAQTYLKRELKNPAIIVDTNHANSNKMPKEQPRIAMEVMRSIKHSRLLKNLIKGFMIESYLVEGTQEISAKVFGKSITDPCLGWEDSRKLILKLAEQF
jgi:3-deoxy-7-phosphoheptulonate synthase